MKIIGKKIPLSGGDYNWAFEIDTNALSISDKPFYDWCESIDAKGKFKLGTYYTSEMFGDIDHSGILIKKNTPSYLISALLLKWA
jgi:hypothetical protein